MVRVIETVLSDYLVEAENSEEAQEMFFQGDYENSQVIDVKNCEIMNVFEIVDVLEDK